MTLNENISIVNNVLAKSGRPFKVYNSSDSVRTINAGTSEWTAKVWRNLKIHEQPNEEIDVTICYHALPVRVWQNF